MSFKTWILILIDTLLIGALIKVLFKKFGNFLKTFWYMEQSSSLADNENNYTNPTSVFKVILVVVITIAMIIIEYKIFY